MHIETSQLDVADIAGKAMSQRFILIVDDEANQRFMLEQALRSTADDYQIATVSSVMEAIDVLTTSLPDLIITDYNMPVMNGLDLIAHIRGKSIPMRIILITAYSSHELYEAAQKLHIDHYLTKPVPIKILRRLTADVLMEDPTAPNSAVSP